MIEKNTEMLAGENCVLMVAVKALLAFQSKENAAAAQAFTDKVVSGLKADVSPDFRSGMEAMVKQLFTP